MPPLEEGIPLDPGHRAAHDLAARMRPRIAPRLREVIASVPEVSRVMSQVGRPDDGTDVTSFFNLEFRRPLEADGTVAEEAVLRFRSQASGTTTISREDIGRRS